MPVFEVKIDQKTYHVDIPWLGAKPLPVIVDGRPLQLVIGEAQGPAAQEFKEAELQAEQRLTLFTSGRPVPAEWHASIREE